MDIHTREPASDRLHAYLDADLWDATAFVEGPLSKRLSAAASFRRSYIDGVLKATHLLDDQLQFTAAPRYYDFQVKATYRAKRGDTLSLIVFGSDDKVELGSNLLRDTGYMSRELFTRTYFYTGGFTWSRRLHKNLENELSIRGGYWVQKGEGSYSASTVRTVPIDVRDELSVDVIPELRLRLGVDTQLGFHKTEVTDRFVEYGLVGPESSIDGGSTSEERFVKRPGMYLQAELLALPKTELTYGIRADYDSLTGSWNADPRFEARCRPLTGTLIKAGLGLFHQPPSVSLVAEVDDAKSLKSMAAVHYGLSVEQIVPRYDLLSFELGGFYKDLSRTSFSHKGLGRAMGMELLIRHRPSRRFFGWISYTLMKSERYMYDDVTAVPFGFDQTHVLSLVAGVSVGHGVDFGLRFRLASGLPYTPIVGERYYDDWFGTSMPIWGGDNSARMPLFHQLDLRVDKRFEWKSIGLSLYLDVQNVYNRQNTVVYLYNSDYSEKRTIYDLPILPSIGLKIEY